VLAIAKKYNVAYSTVKKHLKHLGVLDSSRQNKKKGGPRRSRRPRKNEFLEATKRERFHQEGGCCQICNQLIGDGTNYKVALYHHIKLASGDGNREPENCMVLHPECHQEHFRELHGYDWNKIVEGYTKK
jgi:5-methylcytosine-specific restriction endonuclease McrA